MDSRTLSMLRNQFYRLNLTSVDLALTPSARLAAGGQAEARQEFERNYLKTVNIYKLSPSLKVRHRTLSTFIHDLSQLR
jgi:hypothetical protein